MPQWGGRSSFVGGLQVRKAGSIAGLLCLAVVGAVLWTLPAAIGAASASASAHDAHNRMWERPGTSDWTHGYDDNAHQGRQDDGHHSNGSDEGLHGDDGDDDAGHSHGVPEPGTLALFAVGFAGLALSAQSRRRTPGKAKDRVVVTR